MAPPKQNLNGGGDGVRGGGGPPGGGKGGGGTAKPANPSLITSTGGLLGINGILITPAFNQTTNKSYIINYEPHNNNCEEDAQYTYRQEANYSKFPGEGREASYHLIILKYRELGKCKFSVNITVFKQTIDDFVTYQIPVSIPVLPLTRVRLNNFPDNRIHTIKIAPIIGGVVIGERPQVSITYKANSGPVCVTKLILCGNADEAAQQ